MKNYKNKLYYDITECDTGNNIWNDIGDDVAFGVISTKPSVDGKDAVVVFVDITCTSKVEEEKEINWLGEGELYIYVKDITVDEIIFNIPNPANPKRPIELTTDEVCAKLNCTEDDLDVIYDDLKEMAKSAIRLDYDKVRSYEPSVKELNAWEEGQRDAYYEDQYEDSKLFDED